MGLTENEDLVKISNNLMGEGVKDVGSDEDGGRVSKAEEESHYVAKDPM